MELNEYNPGEEPTIVWLKSKDLQHMRQAPNFCLFVMTQAN